MPTSLPHSPADRALAQVLIAIEQRLAQLRASDDLELMLSLDLNDEELFYHGPAERAARLARFATWEIDLEGGTVQPTQDLYGLAVQHDGQTVSVMFGKRLTGYVAGVILPD
ncbi:MAG TPA: hypothetical protein VMU95_20210 [Trebonia sp.]|nr:hypothetical protein [Trebonia sp.]